MKNLFLILLALSSIVAVAQPNQATQQATNDIVKNVPPLSSGKVYAALDNIEKGKPNYIGTYTATTASTNNYEITIPSPIAWTSGLCFIKVRFADTNTGAATLKINALVTKALVKDVSTPLDADDIIVGKIYDIAYDGTNVQLDLGGSGGGGNFIASDGNTTTTNDLLIDDNDGTHSILFGAINPYLQAGMIASSVASLQSLDYVHLYGVNRVVIDALNTEILDTLKLVDIPERRDTLNQILARDSTTGRVMYVKRSSLGGSGGSFWPLNANADLAANVQINGNSTYGIEFGSGTPLDHFYLNTVSPSYWSMPYLNLDMSNGLNISTYSGGGTDFANFSIFRPSTTTDPQFNSPLLGGGSLIRSSPVGDNNTVKDGLTLTRTLNGSNDAMANGAGIALSFNIKNNGVSGYDYGVSGRIKYSYTDVTDGSEDAKFSFNLPKAGVDTHIADVDGTGLHYSADFSSGATSRWLTDKAYVDAAISGGAFAGTIGSINLTNTTNQLVLGTTNTTTISATAPAASRTWTIPDIGTNGIYMSLTGSQTVTGGKLWAAAQQFQSSVQIQGGLNVTNGVQITMSGTAVAGAYSYGFSDAAIRSLNVSPNTYRGWRMNETVTATAVSQEIYGLVVDPVFVPGAFSPRMVSIYANGTNSEMDLVVAKKVLIGSIGTITASTQVDQRGLGTTSSTINHRWANSSNTVLAQLTDDGAIALNSKIVGRAVLVAGTVTVNTTAIQSGDEIFLTNRITGGTVGLLSVGTVTNGTSFVINSASALDTSTISWMIIKTAP